MNPRRDFLKNLLVGGAAAAIPAKAEAKPEVKIVEKIVHEPFPQNINEEEMAIWLVLKERRRREMQRLKQQDDH